MLAFPPGIMFPNAALAGTPAAYSFTNAEGTAWNARLGTVVADTWKASVDAFFSAIKAGAISGNNILAKMDVCVIPAHAANNWINIVKAAHDPAVLASAPSFSGGGYVFDGVDDEVTTNFNPTTSAGTYTQDLAHFWVYTAAKAANNNSCIGWTAAGTGAFLTPRDGVNDVRWLINSGSPSVFADTSSGVTHVLGNRSAASGAGCTQFYKDGTVRTTTNADITSTALLNANFRMGTANGTAWTGCTITGWGAGGSLTANEVTDLYNAWTTLIAAAGHP